MNNNTTKKTINLTTQFDIQFDVDVKDGKVSWEDVYDKVNEIQDKLNDRKFLELFLLENFSMNVNDMDDYYLGRETLEADLKDDGIELED